MSQSKQNSSMKVEKTLEEREQEYKRVNAELEAQTAELVKEADKVMQKQNSFLYNEEAKEEPADPTLDISEDIRKNLSSLDHDSSALLSIAAGFCSCYIYFLHPTFCEFYIRKIAKNLKLIF